MNEWPLRASIALRIQLKKTKLRAGIKTHVGYKRKEKEGHHSLSSFIKIKKMYLRHCDEQVCIEK